MAQALPVEVRSATVIEDARRALFLELTGDGADPAKAKRLAGKLAGKLARALREAGHLAGSVEQHCSAVEVARLIGRSTEYVGQQLRAGQRSQSLARRSDLRPHRKGGRVKVAVCKKNGGGMGVIGGKNYSPGVESGLDQVPANVGDPADGARRTDMSSVVSVSQHVVVQCLAFYRLALVVDSSATTRQPTRSGLGWRERGGGVTGRGGDRNTMGPCDRGFPTKVPLGIALERIQFSRKKRRWPCPRRQGITINP